MKTARKKPSVTNLRSRRVIIIRSKGEYLGSVGAPDRRPHPLKRFALAHERFIALF